MRLLNTRTLELAEFIGDQLPDYVILSHTWGVDEASYQDVQAKNCQDRKGWSKVLGACKQARTDGFKWIWCDMICIDKSSSAELQESINSMFKWYQKSMICYAYLVDVPDLANGWRNAFMRSRWWTRGWTLQELIAPKRVEFYTAQWMSIGSKRQRHEEITNHTHIPILSLMTTSLHSFSAAERLSWMANRTTTREEDMTYALLGIFGVHMPLLYGEGGPNAFLRLQVDILKKTDDLTILLFATNLRTQPDVIAESPKLFERFRAIEFDESLGIRDSIYDYNQVKSHLAIPPTKQSPLGLPWMPEPATIDRFGLKLDNHIVFGIDDLELPFFQETQNWAHRHDITHCVLLPVSYRDKVVGLLLKPVEWAKDVYVISYDSVCLLSMDMVRGNQRTICPSIRISYRTQKYRTRQKHFSATELSLLLWSPLGFKPVIYDSTKNSFTWSNLGRRDNRTIIRFNLANFKSEDRIDFSLFWEPGTLNGQEGPTWLLVSLNFPQWSPGDDADIDAVEAPEKWGHEMYNYDNYPVPTLNSTMDPPRDRQIVNLRSGICYSIQLKRRPSPNARGATAFGIEVVRMPKNFRLVSYEIRA
jgi:hypothetical protein